MSTPHPPKCLAMVLCDGVHRDGPTGKYTLLGTFSAFSSKEFPKVAKFAVYFAITDGRGHYPLTLRLVNSEAIENPNVQRLVELKGNADFPDPLTVLEGFFLVQVELPTAGLYHCDLLAGAELIMSRRLVALSPAGAQ